MNTRKFSLRIAAALAAALLAVTPVLAAPAYSLFGDAALVAGGNPGRAAEIKADAAGTGYGGVSIPLTPGIAWSSLHTLQLDYNVTDDNCGGGSPRVQIRVDTSGDGDSDGSVHVAIGPSPNFTECAAGWQPTGNLIGNADSGRYDYSQFGGSPFTTYGNAPASVQAGTVVGIVVVVDGWWSAAASGGDGEQTTLVDNVTINSDVVTFEPNTPTSKEQCKQGGWMSLEDANGQPFQNQGQCVSYFNHNS